MARVVICNGDKDFAGRLMMQLHQAGYEVAACKHAMDVMRDAARGGLDAVILDLDMPGFGSSFGIEALREIAPHVPVIGISDKAQKQTSDLISFALLPRAASPEQFLRAVERALIAPFHNETLPPPPPNDEARSSMLVT